MYPVCVPTRSVWQFDHCAACLLDMHRNTVPRQVLRMVQLGCGRWSPAMSFERTPGTSVVLSPLR